MPDPAEDRGDDLDGLQPDAAAATDLGDEKDREAEQLKYYGGDPIEDDLGDDDLSALDRGDSVLVDEGDDDGEEEEKVDESEDEDDEAESEEDDSTEEEADDADDDDSSDESADDGDEEDSEDDESADDDDDDESEDDEPRDQGIPRRRFNEVNERMKRAEARLEQLEKTDEAEEQAEEEQYDFDAKEIEYMDLLLDGKTTEAAALRKEIRAAEKVEFQAAAREETHSTVNQDAAVRELNQLTAQAQNLYPVLDEKSDDYDPSIAGKVVTFMKGYIGDGEAAGDAFVSALSDTIDLYDLDTKYGDTEDQEEEDPKPKKKVVKKKGKIKKTKEKLDLAKKQAKTPAGEGSGSSDAGLAVPDIDKMTDAEIDALPAETLARIRGDFVEE